MGIVSCLCNDQVSVTASLRELEAGIQFIPEYADLGLRSQVAGRPQIDLDALIDRKLKRFMGDAAAYAYVSMRDAIADAGLTDEHVRDVHTGLIAGSGGGSPQWQIERSDEHTSELQSLMRISYAGFCLKKKQNKLIKHNKNSNNRNEKQQKNRKDT